MQVEELSISAVKPYEKNPRKNDRAVDGVAESIKKFGFQQPIVVDKDGVIVAGHTRYKAALKLGLATVPCVRADLLNKEEVKAYRILDNKLNELSSWDFETLSNELASFQFNFEGFDVQIPTFDSSSSIVSEWNSNAQSQAPTATPATNVAPTSSVNVQTATQADNLDLSTLPPELQGVRLDPDPMQEIKGDDQVMKSRIIIAYSKEREDEVARLIGVEKIIKCVYTLEELLDK